MLLRGGLEAVVLALYASRACWLVLQRLPCPYPLHLTLLLGVVLSLGRTALGQSEPGHLPLSPQQGFVGTAATRAAQGASAQDRPGS